MNRNPDSGAAPCLEKLLDGTEVEWKTLGEVAFINRGHRVTKKELSPEKEYPVYSGGITPMGYYEKYNQDEDTITVVKYGTAGFVNFIVEKFWANDVCYCVKPTNVLINKYLLYVLKNYQDYINSLATDAIPAHLPTEAINSISIPIPPLPVQKEIVRILDAFTELTTELTARKKQYEYYREQLLRFEANEVEWKTLGEVAELRRGKRLTKKLLSLKNKYPVFHGGLEPLGFYSNCNRVADTVMIINVGASAGTVGYSNVDFWSSDGCYCIEHSDSIDSRFLYYALVGEQHFLKSRVRKAGIPTLDAYVIEKLQIPIPPLLIQKEIVRVLDKFDTLTTSISEGLPKEIALRQKQYAYYREGLLSFNG